MKKDCCSSVYGGKDITFGFGSAKHSSPIESVSPDWPERAVERLPRCSRS